MPEIIDLIVILLLGCVSGFFSATVGGSSMVSIPGLILFGLPPQIAVATDKLGGLGSQASSLFKFWKSGKIMWSYVLPLAVISLISSIIGANILLNIDPEILQKSIGVILLIMLPVIFVNKNFGLESKESTKLKKYAGYVIFFILQIFNTFVAGVGPLIFYAFVFFFGFSMTEASATRIIPLTVVAVSSTIIFAVKGIVDYQVGIVLLIGMLLGGYIGAHTALEKGDKWVKDLFAVMVIIASFKLLFF